MVREYLINLGYTSSDVDKIISSYSIVGLNENTLYENIKRNYEFFRGIGISTDRIIKITNLYPSMYAHTKDYIETKIKNIVSLGYKNKSCVISMLISFPQIIGLSIGNMEKKIKDLETLGFSHEEVIKLTKDNPQIFGINIDTIKKKIEDIISLGYTYNDVIKMIKRYSQLLNFGIDNLKRKIDGLEVIGYHRNSIIKMTKKMPTIYALNINNIKNKMSYMEKLGYDKKSVMHIINTYPQLLGFSIDAIKNRIMNLIELGFSYDDVIKMTSNFSELFGLSIETLRDKKEFYDSIGLSRIMVDDTKQLMQSLELSYARYMYYKSLGIEIGQGNYKILFIGSKRFEKKYGIIKEELIFQYDYYRDTGKVREVSK